jgi:uncharacterized protein involved in exopolysaccharide biosynthesis
MPELIPLDIQSTTLLGLRHYLDVILKYKRMIMIVTGSTFVTSIIITLLMAKTYSSTALITPPQQDSNNMLSMVMGQLGGGMGSIATDLLGKNSSADLYVTILKSEAIKDKIIDRFKLIDLYKQKYRLDTYKVIDKKVKVEAGKKDGIISITVLDKDPQRAADIANAYVKELNKLAIGLSITGASTNKAYLEERLVKAKTDLANAEDAIKSFQTKTKTLDITEQAKGTIKGVGDLESQLAIEEVKLAGMRRMFTDSSQDVKNQQLIVANIKLQIAKFEGTRSNNVIPGVGSIPTIGQEYLRLTREFKVQEALVEFLTKQYEIAKLTELKEVSTLQVIQHARSADKKVKPKRILLVLSATTAAFLFSILLSYVLDIVDMMSDEQRQYWKSFTKRLFPI